jgi:hypothetical protein
MVTPAGVSRASGAQYLREKRPPSFPLPVAPSLSHPYTIAAELFFDALGIPNSIYEENPPKLCFDDCFCEFQVAYCDNEVDCRRTLQLAHFGENFDARLCKGTCDNCARGSTFVETDVTEAAKQLVSGGEEKHTRGRPSPCFVYLNFVVSVGLITALTKKRVVKGEIRDV